MGYFIILIIIFLIANNRESTSEKIRRITTKLSLTNPATEVNISAITILIQEGYDEKLIIKYYPAINKVIKSYVVIHNDDIYSHKRDFLSRFENLRDKEAERLAEIKEQEVHEAKMMKGLKILALPAIIVLGVFINSENNETKAEKIQDENRTLAQIYGEAVKKAFEQAATEGDSANTVAELSDNVGKKYLSPELNYQGKKFYISDIEGFESYALLDSAIMCGEYSYDYDELVNRVKKYKFTDGCYDGKYFYMVKPVYTAEEKTTHDLQEELKKLRTEIETLKTNNR
ncbi:hypothetical protein OX88_21550 [Pseudomonas coronafaciens pv. porri]|uniref:hypothetical protein n=1 Tax=Pseudomonas coronafaciens TaxID=53409 RepID=UPI0006AB7F29|nr:hypothetical protein [Pseudomonas coronafaciens]KOP53077.1 hypothetical protein OX88_21550 [Pseudomonas coronafaciens pv. porri]